ncbi:type-F conjugative transfer system secretin TraK [Novosphingobium sp. ERW19]|nr:type-F conjugative transfer system secretin TraK [Novosphingobium sp. ERW19]
MHAPAIWPNVSISVARLLRSNGALRAHLSAILSVGACLVAKPALADQSVRATDNGTVGCIASAKDLTRISLAGDQFASVSRISTGNAEDDFKIVNEPTRGDIYLSVPDGYAKQKLSFFGTTRKGYVYKFVCEVRGEEAEQLFVTNSAIQAQDERQALRPKSPEETATRLVQAMYRGEAIDGFEQAAAVLAPVRIGKLEVQQIGQYQGENLRGLILRVRNTAREPIKLDEQVLSARGAVAFMAPVSELAPNAVSAVYLIHKAGAR